MKPLITAAYHQCNIFNNHFTHSPSTSSPSTSSPSITNIIIITITIMVFVITLSILQWIILYSMLCPPFVSLCDSVQIYSVIVPAEAVWQPDQLHLDNARVFLALQLQLMTSTSKGGQWGLWALKALAHPILHIQSLVKQITSGRIYRWLIWVIYG